MTKPRKEGQELERMILERCRDAGMQIHSVKVFPSPAYGWDANFVASAALVIGYRSRFEAIVSQIRAEFDLKAS
jgi:hypothetical protein